MHNTNSKPLSPVIFIPLIFLIFIRPFFSGLAYPTIELYYENFLIFLAIITLFFYRPRPNNYSIPIILLLFSYIISSIYSVNIQNSIKEIIKFISYISIFFIVSQSNEDQKKLILKTIVLGAAIISIYTIYQYFWGYQHTLDYIKKIQSNILTTSSYAKDILITKRAIATFPSPNFLGGYLVIAFFIALSFLLHTKQIITLRCLVRGKLQRESIFLLITILFALLLTKSMGSWLSLSIILVILFLSSIRAVGDTFRRKVSPNRLAETVPYRNIGWCLIPIALALTFILFTRSDRFINLANPQNSMIQRLSYWRTAIAVIKDHPIVGVGPGNFQEVFGQYKIGPADTDTRYAHNIFLHQWSETGILGLIGILYLIISFFRKSRNQLPSPLRHCEEAQSADEAISYLISLSCLAFLFHNLIDNTYFIPQVGIFWWVLIGLILPPCIKNTFSV